MELPDNAPYFMEDLLLEDRNIRVVLRAEGAATDGAAIVFVIDNHNVMKQSYQFVSPDGTRTPLKQFPVDEFERRFRMWNNGRVQVEIIVDNKTNHQVRFNGTWVYEKDSSNDAFNKYTIQVGPPKYKLVLEAEDQYYFPLDDLVDQLSQRLSQPMDDVVIDDHHFDVLCRNICLGLAAMTGPEDPEPNPTLIHILGCTRKVITKDDTQYIRYEKQRITLAEAYNKDADRIRQEMCEQLRSM